MTLSFAPVTHPVTLSFAPATPAHPSPATHLVAFALEASLERVRELGEHVVEPLGPLQSYMVGQVHHVQYMVLMVGATMDWQPADAKPAPTAAWTTVLQRTQTRCLADCNTLDSSIQARTGCCFMHACCRQGQVRTPHHTTHL